MAEWLNAAVLKTVIRGNADREFESLPLRIEFELRRGVGNCIPHAFGVTVPRKWNAIGAKPLWGVRSEAEEDEGESLPLRLYSNSEKSC